jgi:hypothetical protein
MTIDFATKQVELTFLQMQLAITFKESRQTNPDGIRLQGNDTPKSLLTTAK